MEQIQQNMYAWRAFHLDEGNLTPIWYTNIDQHQRATAIMRDGPWFRVDDDCTPYRFDLHSWNCSDITPAEDLDDEDWKQSLPASRNSLMRATQAGFHCFKHAVDAAAYAEHNTAKVLGKVQIAGRVIEHDYGYRTQLLRITELYLNYDSPTDLPVADQLGWPFELKTFTEAIISDRGETPPLEEGFGKDG